MSNTKPPSGWGQDSLSEFLEAANHNTFGVFVLYKDWFSLLQGIDSTFDRFTEHLLNPSAFVESFLFLRAHYAYRGAIRLAVSGQLPEAYCIFRVCLEYSLYGFFLYKHPELVEVWLSRNESKTHKRKVQNEFRLSRMLAELEKEQPAIGKIARFLYEYAIDVGAHPNPKAVTFSLETTHKEDRLSFFLAQLDDNPLSLVAGFKAGAQVGICSLKLFKIVFPERFDILGISDQIESLSKTTVNDVRL